MNASKTTEPWPAELRVCVLREGGMFLAQGVDFDIAAAGETADAATDGFMRELRRQFTVARHLGIGTFDHVPPPREDLSGAWEAQVRDHGETVRWVNVPADGSAGAAEGRTGSTRVAATLVADAA